MLQGVWEFFKDVLEEQSNSVRQEEEEELLTPPYSPKQVSFEMTERQQISDYIQEYWDFVTDFYGGKPPTCTRHLLAGICRYDDFWIVPNKHILSRFLKNEETIYVPLSFMKSDYGDFVVFDTETIYTAIQCIAELCKEHGKEIDLNQLEPTEILI